VQSFLRSRLVGRLPITALAAVAMLIAGIVSAAAASGAQAASTSTSATSTSTASSSSRATVPAGITPSAVPGAQVFGTTAANTPETVSFVLREQDLSQLEAQAEQGFRQFLSVGQFAQQYGANTGTISQLTSYLSHYGIKTQVYADHVDVVANGTAGEFDSALDVQQQNYSAPAIPAHDGVAGHPAQQFHGTQGNPSLPSSLAQSVVAVLGLTNYAAFESGAAHVNTATAQPQSSSTNSCIQLSGLPDGCNLPQNFAQQYNLNPLYQQHAEGQGQTIAIVTLASLDPGAPQYFWKNIAHIQTGNRSVSTVNIDGGAGAPSDAAGSGETDIDVEQSGGLAPDANVIVYQAPNTDFGFADAFFDAASQNIASTVSASWLESETYLQSTIVSSQESPGYEAAFDEAFLEMAAQGQSGFIASGDEAAYTATGDLGTTNLSVGTSADSPFITAAGGTTLPWSGTLTDSTTGLSASVSVPAQRIWGWDYLWQPVATISQESLAASAESQVVGGGGGFSTIEPEPSYQRGVPGTSQFSAVPYLTPTDYQSVGGLNEPTEFSFNPTPGIISGQGGGRAVPDVSADADPYSGYLLYEPSFAGVNQPVLQGGWGGTSFVAPQLNGSTAVIDSYLGRRVGFWNPAIYSAATSSRSPFTPLNQRGTSNDNLFYTGTPGTLFNEGAGLGTPNLASLAGDF
jgi:kumamolisin